MAAVTYTLLIDGVPAGEDLLQAIQSIEVEEHTDKADMLRLTLAIGLQDEGGNWALLDDDLFGRLANLRLLVSLGTALPEHLIDAYVVETQAQLSMEPGHSMLEVVAMDTTVLMNLEEKVESWPDMADSDIATAIFANYGLTPVVEATQPTRQQPEYMTIQRGTDIRFLSGLAERNGYECFVEVNPATGLVEGHFHPPRLDLEPQAVLSVNMGEATSVDRFEARYEMMRPCAAEARSIDVPSLAEQPAISESTLLTELGRNSLLSPSQSRRRLLSGSGLSKAGELQTFVQGVVDRSAWAIEAEGDLHTASLGHLLRAKRPVLVRGAGPQFSGTYYVERVLHGLGEEGPTQNFSLRRNALGSSAVASAVSAKLVASA